MARIRRSCPTLLLLIAMLVLPGFSGIAQEIDIETKPGEPGEESPAQEAPLDSGLVEEVRVDVVQFNFLAFDRKERPITDLQPEELELELNGNKVRVAFLDRNAIAGESLEPKPGRRSRKGADEAPKPGETTRRDQDARWIVLFFDSYTAGPRTRLKSVDAAAAWMLTDMQPGDHVSVIDFDGKLKVLQPFTKDQRALQEALQKVSEASPVAYSDRNDTLETLRTTFENCAEKGSGGYALACIQPYISSYEADRLREQRDFISGLLLLMRSMAPIPHIKSIIMFSDGFTRVPGQDAIDVASTVVGFRAAMSLNMNFRPENDAEYREITEAASKAKVSIHTIMPGGGKSFGFISAAQAKPLDETRGSRIDYHARSAKNYQQGFTELALRTGGSISLNADPALALDRVLDQSKGLYTVGVYTTGVQAFRDYSFKIKCKRRGVRIRSWERMPRLRIPPKLNGELEAKASQCKPGDRRALDLRVTIPRRELLFKPVPGGRSANFSVFVTMMDKNTGETLFEEYRFFNIKTASSDPRTGPGADPEMNERFLAPCRPLVISAAITDAEGGSMGKLLTSID